MPEWIDLTILNGGKQFTSSSRLTAAIINAILTDLNYIKQKQEASK